MAGEEVTGEQAEQIMLGSLGIWLQQGGSREPSQEVAAGASMEQWRWGQKDL